MYSLIEVPIFGRPDAERRAARFNDSPVVLKGRVFLNATEKSVALNRNARAAV